MQEGNDGILKTVEKANEYFHKVKQTSDATIDSRLLVSAADLSFKKTAHLALGDSAAGIDVDEFVSKCIAFMRQGSTDSSTSLRPAGTQRRRHGRPSGGTQRDPDDSEDDQGDAMNWDWLGRAACFPHNGRPCVSGFLLGPLSVQKRTRQQTQRRARERIDPTQAVKPQELREEDLDKLETSNLTQMCAEINKLLSQTQLQGQQAVEAEMSQMAEDVPAEVVQDVMEQHCVADDGGVPLFHFCLDPESFGQSVENMFYVSFLVRDGLAGIATDSRGLPTIHAAKPYAPSEAQKKGIQKHQAVFSLDFETWEKLIEVYGIKKSVIPHRAEAAPPETTRQGWYG
ncbi:hypothetical protein ASPZODRAFT_130338 [Penicilliopsis zonata CBS 506.65]|uniref:Non-structural maintenance of chromosomes element 4 n=1 Tax=Penicilliopsis zonata CBS 506.65 TaxID=1073090 RepID=A0A1L9SMK9_9EURO|nr:hypothetical protein ASPZODRAFT_130338 [Penicilliopsis zonata CBS 506.65]OJJ48346.1 hypothetical protein ASPZODRAFT_130338 [Penicilliopsis zonata CBS 506.65]